MEGKCLVLPLVGSLSIAYVVTVHYLHVVLKCLLLIFFSADFHDYHHRLLYTKSGNYSSTFTYMDW
jgi:sterol desaturase/sphingolipid hydroxylase (fatty acid hydroxylase superfamily)